MEWFPITPTSARKTTQTCHHPLLLTHGEDIVDVVVAVAVSVVVVDPGEEERLLRLNRVLSTKDLCGHKARVIMWRKVAYGLVHLIALMCS
jgi:hypothetical protein